MQHFRRTLLTVLVLATIVASLVGFYGASSALPSRGLRDPLVPATPVPQDVIDPNNGEPDSGSSRSKLVSQTANRFYPAMWVRSAIPAIPMLPWTSFVWAKRVLGIGG